MTQEERDALDKACAEHRKKSFQLSVGPSEWRRGEVQISVTTNGMNWSSIQLTPDEFLKLRKAINEYEPV